MSLKAAGLKLSLQLKKYTSIKIGGRLKYFFEVSTKEELARVFSDFGREIYLLGAGSNILAKDGVIKRPVVKLGEGFNFIKKKGPLVTAGAATGLNQLLNYCLKNDLAGPGALAGIPATVGGLLATKAEAFGVSLADYSKEIISSAEGIILQAQFLFPAADELKAQIAAFLKRRLATQDYSFPSCGCIFKNPTDFAAGALIDSCGLKGIQRGGACVSLKHANFILNRDQASYDDVDYLISQIKEKVFKKYSIILEEEIVRWI